jgi:hypothetical protein
MPKRVIDFDAMWGSDKLAACAEWAQAEYAWLYGLADASGCFEMTNLRVIWGRVAAIRRNLSLERLEQIFQEFHAQGLLFVWEENGKRYGHWTGSDVPGRLPPPSWRMRLERLAPPVPKQQLAEFMSRFSRGRAASPGGSFFVESSSGSPQGSVKLFAHGAQDKPFAEHAQDKPSLDGGLKAGLEAAQAQDLDWNRKQEVEWKRCALPGRAAGSGSSWEQPNLSNLNSKTEMQRPEASRAEASPPDRNSGACAAAASSGTVPLSSRDAPAAPSSYARFTENAHRERDKSFVVLRELQVGRGPECGPGSVKPEALERIRARNAARSP